MKVIRLDSCITLPYSFGVHFCSDIHIGGLHTDYSYLHSELQNAKDSGCRINIAGDIFEGIVPGDKKRFRIGELHPRLRAAGDAILDETLTWGVEVLEPFAENIDVIASGNHDDAVLKYHNTDIINNLICVLNKKLKDRGSKHRIQYGDYCGWIIYRFYKRKMGFVDSLRIRWHHGKGGAAQVTKGLIDFNRTKVWTEGADILWYGHKHNKIYNPIRVNKLKRDGSELINKTVFFILTADYSNLYEEHDDPKRQSNFAVDRDLAPEGKGGITIKTEILDKFTKKIVFEDGYIMEIHNE